MEERVITIIANPEPSHPEEKQELPEIPAAGTSTAPQTSVRKNRKRLHSGDTYATPDTIRNWTQEKVEVQRRMMKKRKYLLDLQLKDMEFRVKEAEYLMKIAQKKQEKDSEK